MHVFRNFIGKRVGLNFANALGTLSYRQHLFSTVIQ
jgi:hypothetical protein